MKSNDVGTYCEMHVIGVDDVRAQEVIPSTSSTGDISGRRLGSFLHQALLSFDVLVSLFDTKRAPITNQQVSSQTDWVTYHSLLMKGFLQLFASETATPARRTAVHKEVIATMV
jgi:hypothetical protein